MSTSEQARRAIDFDHHSADLTAEVSDLGVGAALSPLRERCPIGWTEAHGGYWVATGYDEIQKISRNDEVFSSDHDPQGLRKSYTGVTIPVTYPVPLGFIEMDAPEHTLIRKALLPWFTQKAVDGWRPVLEDLTTAFIDRVIEDGECDFIEAIASPVPAVLTMMLLGAPLERWGLWSAAHHRTVAAMPTGPERDQATAEMMQVMGDLVTLIGETRANPPSGEPKNLIELLCVTEIGGRLLANEEILLHAVLITAGGTDTTTTALTFALKWLDYNPEARQRLSEASPELMATAIEEFIRVSAPVTALARTAKCPADVGDQHLEADERVLMFYAAANYDPLRFPDPERVDIERSPNPHTSFGLSNHRCIGMHFARLELDVVLREVLKRMPDFKVDHDGARRNADVGVNQGWVELPVSFTPGRRLGSTFQPAEP